MPRAGWRAGRGPLGHNDAERGHGPLCRAMAAGFFVQLIRICAAAAVCQAPAPEPWGGSSGQCTHPRPRPTTP